MKIIALFLCLYQASTHCLAQDNPLLSFEKGEDILLKRGRIWSGPTSQSRVLMQEDNDSEIAVVMGGLHDRFLTVDSDTLINNYLRITYKDTSYHDLIGWVYAKNVERKPIPGTIPDRLDSVFATKYLNNCTWKLYNGSAAYSKYVHAHIYTSLANNYYDKKLYAKAVAEYSKAVALSPTNYRLVKRAFAKSELGDYVGAINDLNKVTATKRETWTDISLGRTFEYSETEILNANGYCKLKTDRFSEALADFTRSLSLNSRENAEAFYYRAFCYLNMNTRIKACNDFSKAGEQGFNGAYEEIKKYCN